MSVRLATNYTRYTLDSDADALSLPVSSVEAGSEAVLLHSGRRWVYNGVAWQEQVAPTVQTAADASGDVLLELQAIRKGIELALALTHGVHTDLLTETVTEVTCDGVS